MDARQRRMWVLPAPKGSIDKRDRYAIGIFYSFGLIVAAIIKPIRALFDSISKKPTYFKSKIRDDVFISMRKIGKNV